MADYNPLNNLPQEIPLNIFSRLPAESVLVCKEVCRGWRDFLHFHANTTYFAGLHLQCHYGSDSRTMSFLVCDKDTPEFWYLEYHADDKRTNYRVMFRVPEGACVRLAGSENGLICISVKTEYKGIPAFRGSTVTDSPDEPYCICNPVTKTFVTLPGILINEKKSVHIVHGFGYHPLTNAYKVVRICYLGNPNHRSFKGQVEVYTLGSGSGWRSVGETDYYFKPKRSSNPTGVCVNGALHWLCDDLKSIVAFDLADETFHLIRTPDMQMHKIRRIFVLRRCLCLEYSGSNFLELWFYHMNGHCCKSWSWNREFALPLGEFRFFSIFSITRLGEILLTNGRQLVCYNPNERRITSQEILELNEKQMCWDIPVSHINSFVSLEALGETSVEKFVEETSAEMSLLESLAVCFCGFIAPLFFLLLVNFRS